MHLPFSILLLLLLTATTANAQKEKAPRVFYYTYDEKGAPCNAKTASYRGILKEFDDTTWQYSYYKNTGPLVYVETYRDKQMQQPHGYVALFDQKGRVDTSGFVYKQRREGWWNYYDDSLVVIRSELYEKGKLIREKTKEELVAERKRKNGPDEYDATFKGGKEDWAKYLVKKLRVPAGISKTTRSAQAKILFTVGIDGYTHDVRVLKSIGLAGDEEAIKIIRLSPQWHPARKDGRLVKSLVIQPVTFTTY
jgi:hypothetical protein